MGLLRAYADTVDRLNEVLGRTVAWLMLPVVLIAFVVVVLRYAFSSGFPWLQELYIWMHGIAFMTAAGWVLKEEGHVRVDVLLRRWSPRARAWVDLFGVFAFLLPMMAVMAWISWPVVQRSWRLMETSPTADGLRYLFVVKSFLLVFVALVTLQGLALAARAVLRLRDRTGEAGAG